MNVTFPFIHNFLTVLHECSTIIQRTENVNIAWVSYLQSPPVCLAGTVFPFQLVCSRPMIFFRLITFLFHNSRLRFFLLNSCKSALDSSEESIIDAILKVIRCSIHAAKAQNKKYYSLAKVTACSYSAALTAAWKCYVQERDLSALPLWQVSFLHATKFKHCFKAGKS